MKLVAWFKRLYWVRRLKTMYNEYKIKKAIMGLVHGLDDAGVLVRVRVGFGEMNVSFTPAKTPTTKEEFRTTLIEVLESMSPEALKTAKEVEWKS